MASAPGAPKVCSMRTIKSDVVVGLGENGDAIAANLDAKEAGWKISGKYVRKTIVNHFSCSLIHHHIGRDTRLRRQARRDG